MASRGAPPSGGPAVSRSAGAGSASSSFYALVLLPLLLAGFVFTLQTRQMLLFPEAHELHSHGMLVSRLREPRLSTSAVPQLLLLSRSDEEAAASPAATHSGDTLHRPGDQLAASFSHVDSQALIAAFARFPGFQPALAPPQAPPGAQPPLGASGAGNETARQSQLGRVKPALPIRATGTADQLPDLAEWQLPRAVGDGLAADPAGPSARALRFRPVLIATTTGDPFERIATWYRYHRAIGVDVFYLFVEATAAQPDTVAALRTLPGVTVYERTPELVARQRVSRIWNETWLAAFFNKPCNYELFVRQNLNLEIAIRRAFREGIDWIVHIDTDELLYPGGPQGYNLKRLLGGVAPDVETFVFPNYESAVEHDMVSDPFTEVTMFKRNFDHVIREVYFTHYKAMTRGNPNYFLTYGNGKSAARVVPGLRPNGAHRFHNYNHPPREMKAEEAAVLHYTYARFEDVRARRGRCNCGLSEKEVKVCFILEFDRWVFQKATAERDDGALRSWYRDRVVWSNRKFVRMQLANGLFERIYAPSLIMMGLDAAGGSARSYAGGLRPLMHNTSRTRPDEAWNVPPMRLSRSGGAGGTGVRSSWRTAGREGGPPAVHAAKQQQQQLKRSAAGGSGRQRSGGSADSRLVVAPAPPPEPLPAPPDADGADAERQSSGWTGVSADRRERPSRRGHASGGVDPGPVTGTGAVEAATHSGTGTNALGPPAALSRLGGRVSAGAPLVGRQLANSED